MSQGTTTGVSTVDGSPSALGRAGWHAAWYDAFKDKPVRVREAIVASTINSIYRDNPSADPRKVMEVVVAFRQKYDREVMQGRGTLYQTGKTLDFLVNRGLGILEGVEVEGGLVVVGLEVNPAKIVSEVYKAVTTNPYVEGAIERWTAEWANEAQYEAVSKWADQVPGILGEVTNTTNPLHKEAINRALVNTSIPALPSGEFQNPVIMLEPMLIKIKPESAQRIRSCIRPNGSFSMSEDELRKILKEELGGIEGRLGTLETMMNETLETMQRIDAQQKDILAWIANEEAQRREQAARQLESQRHQLMIDGANSTVYLVSTLVGLSNPKLSREIMVVGSSAIQIYDAVEKFVDALPELQKLGNLAVGLSGAVMTGNIVGAVMNVVALFADQGPTPEEMILDQLGKLQEQVGLMHQQMHERFDRIEEYLDAIYGGINAIFDLVNTRFNQMQVDVNALIRDADQIQEELARQELYLGRLAQSVHKGIQDGFRHDFNAAFNSALGYKDRNGVNMSLSQFNEWEGEFYTWAVDDAKNENEQPLAGRSYEDDRVLSELEETPLEENVMYLSNWLQRRAGLSPLTSTPLVNPITWGISTWAYTQLLVENPQYAVTGSYPNRQAAVESEGAKLRTGLRRITIKQDTSTGPHPNYELFEFLIENYKQKAGVLDAALGNVESNYLFNWKTLTIQRGPGEPDVDPWSGAQQSIAYAPPFPPNTPSTVLSFIPAYYLLAEYMKLDDPPLSIGLVPEWTEERTEVTAGSKRTTEVTYAKLKVTATVKYKGTAVLARHVLGDEVLIRRTITDNWSEEPGSVDTYSLDPDTAFDQNWTTGQNLKARFEAGSHETSPTRIVHDVVNRVEDKLREVRSGICSETLAELGDGQSLYAPARRLDGAKALVDRFVNLGMPLALWSDDFLRSMLYGTQSLVDRGQVLERYLLATNPRAPLGHYVSLRSHNFPTRFVRHRNYLGEISEVHSDLDKQDSTFRMVPGLVDAGTVSLESINFPSHYLIQNADHRLKLRPFDAGDPDFQSYATFSVVEGLAAPGGVSFRSHGNPENHMRHYNFELWAQSGSDNLFRQDATFHVTLRNPREFIKQDADARADALGASLKGYLQRIGEQTHIEEQGMVESTLVRSQALSVVVKALTADARPPRVKSVTPAENATEVRRNTHLMATFSEKMNRSTLTNATFLLYRINPDGTTTQIKNATVVSSPDGLKATLNPFGTSSTLLAKNTRYKAVITTDARDAANNPLDQGGSKAGRQPKVWSFKTGLR